MTDWTRASALEMADAMRAGTVTSVELVQAHLDRIAAVDGSVHAFLHVDAQGALATAAAVDADREALTPAVIKKLADHPLTDKGLEAFLSDWAKTGQKIL